jgi:signal transduction histidine kinase/CheY-like chemotaxis protein
MEQRVAERTAELQQALSDLHKEIDDHRQAEDRLRQSEKLKAVGQLTGGIAHDFNNTLQGIVSALALVRGRLAQGRISDALGYVEPAEKAAARAGALTHRLLAFSRQQTLAPKPVDLDQIARGMEDMIRRAVGPGVQVELKSGNGHWLVLCDPNQMESALLNLCINARDAMPEGGWLTISIEERTLLESEVTGFEELRPGRYVSLAVTDTGTGMTPEVAGHMFEPFFTTKPQGQGIGLGLSQIYGFIRQSGGLVQVETAPGAGTTIRLCLPCHRMASTAPTGVPGNGKIILLVEDEHDLRRMLADQLRDLGYGVMEADAADAALRIVSAGTWIDLLVTDIGLRGDMDGRQLARSFREQRPEVPVIFITGFAGDHTMTNEIVLRKPFKPSVLSLLVQEHIA